MPEVSVSVELNVVVEPGMTPVDFEQAVKNEGSRAARQLYVRALEVLDEQAVKVSGGARQRLESRWVATTFGRVRVHRYRVKTRRESFHPLDRELHLGSSEPSAALRELVCDLALRVPYRQAAAITTRITGEVMSHQSAWRILQQEGACLRNEEGELVASVFELGEAPPEMDAPELLVVESGRHIPQGAAGGVRSL